MKTFKQTYKVKATPEEVYMALTNEFTIELWTGYPAVMSAEAGSQFEMWNGDIAVKILN